MHANGHYISPLKESYENSEEFLSDLHKARRANHNKWIIAVTRVHGAEVEIKLFNTYLQIYRISGHRWDSGTMDMSVKDLSAELSQPWKYGS